MADDLSRLPWLIEHARRTRRTIVVNIAAAVGLKAAFLALAVLGLANLWMAILADMGASLAVTFNGMRMLGAPCEPTPPADSLWPRPARCALDNHAYLPAGFASRPKRRGAME